MPGGGGGDGWEKEGGRQGLRSSSRVFSVMYKVEADRGNEKNPASDKSVRSSSGPRIRGGGRQEAERKKGNAWSNIE